MKISKKAFALSAATGALIAGVTVPSASASTAEPQPTEWGVRTITINPNDSSITPMAWEYAGGGIWSYGSELTARGERCWSKYDHDSKKHSATADMTVKSDKDIQAAGITASASTTAGTAYTCKVYWGVY
ncbi:lactococcin 972 family bacteriocin [Streptomyces sp. IPPR8]|uniref:lactococcin 972 family bacteriocin n=1 Tax=Streptomyces TaxID=1883 RepID=UPI0022BA2414|nr:lactococcin 972 family bacteriocin [Streptomyces mutabilis]MCZ9355279.1 lactococcin 972 family bacteriocin [Streptomyces mutabilis]